MEALISPASGAKDSQQNLSLAFQVKRPPLLKSTTPLHVHLGLNEYVMLNAYASSHVHQIGKTEAEIPFVMTSLFSFSLHMALLP